MDDEDRNRELTEPGAQSRPWQKKLINKQNFQEPESVMSELHHPKIHVLKSQPLSTVPLFADKVFKEVIKST